MKFAYTALLTGSFLVLTWTPAYAYIDAGTGSMILQLLLGGVAGFLVLLKLYWHRVKDVLGIRGKDTPDSDSSDS